MMERGIFEIRAQTLVGLGDLDLLLVRCRTPFDHAVGPSHRDIALSRDGVLGALMRRPARPRLGRSRELTCRYGPRDRSGSRVRVGFWFRRLGLARLTLSRWFGEQVECHCGRCGLPRSKGTSMFR